MSSENKTQLFLLDSRSIAVRIALVALALAAITAAFFTVRWQIGRMLADTASPGEKNYVAVASIASRLAPYDPFAVWTAASAERSNFLPEQMHLAERSYESVVRLSPNEYRFWLDLGRTRELTDNASGAEAAFRRAVELAPNYAYPHWMLGNFLLRSGRRDEAFAEFRKVAETHSTLRQQVFYLAWENIGQNAAEIEAAVGNAPQIRAALAPFYAAKKLPDDALRIWQSLSQAEKEEFRSDGETAAKVLFEKQHFRAAVAMYRELGVANAEIGQIQNGGFESEINNSNDNFLGWQVQKLKNLDVTIDAGQRREGRRSLRLTFNGFREPTLQAATQYVAVEPNARYRLSFAVKTTELKSAGTPLVEAVDARTTKTLAASQPFADGTKDWQNVSVEFSTSADLEAVLIRTVRAFCGENCPIVGVVWYDEFKLERLGKNGK
ncbi:MAG TPA: carbohydrate binding domain-containing protein [Pyrinomonadaceae bacterium]|nr:carbohydrate binding domain-containing protein [Pyrinomonadaceae bacterium]